MLASGHADPEQYLDFEIRVFPREEKGFPVEITLGGQQRFERGYISPEMVPWVGSADLIADGRRLFDSLFADRALRSAWDRALGRSDQRRIRFWIDEDATELHAVPWELLQDDRAGADMLSAQTDTPFSRYLRIDVSGSSPVEERPIRVLVVISNPLDLKERYKLDPVDVDLETRNLREAFSTVGQTELEAEFLEAPATLEKLGEKLFSGYHVLHYVGHGKFSDKTGHAALFLQDQEMNTQLVRDDELAGLLRRQGTELRLVSLVACQSAARSAADAFLGLGPKLVNAGVPAIVAMQDFVTVETARKFSATFYRLLLEHGQVDLATNQARGALLTLKRWDAGVPVLFMRVSNGRLFAPRPSGKKEKAKPAVAALPPGFDPDRVNLIDLRKGMIEAYDRPGLITLCSELAFEYDDISVEFDNLRGEAVPSKVLELIQWHKRRRRVGDLVRKVLSDHQFLVDDLA